MIFIADWYKSELDSFNNDSIKAEKFMELVKKYTDFTNLSASMIHEFIEKVVVHEADKSSGMREQQVDIYLNFIGMVDIPEIYEADEEPQEPLTPDEQKRKIWREYKQREREKKRQKKLAERNITV